MAKLYNENKHFDLSFALTKGQAIFDNIDFSQAGNFEVEKILNSEVPNILFYECIFTNLNLTNKTIQSNISFSRCLFKGETDFSDTIFTKNTSFENSEFNGITKFNDTIFKQGVLFTAIHTKPARSGYFYYRGDNIDYYGNSNKLYEYSTIFNDAIFETEVSFYGRKFRDYVSFKNTVFYNKFWFSMCSIGIKAHFSPKFECDGIRDIDICYRILRNALSKDGYSIQVKTLEERERKIIEKQNKEDTLSFKANNTSNLNSHLLTTEEAAKYLGLKMNTLERWRCQYPDRLPFVKIGRTVKYRLEDLQNYISKNVK